MTNTNSILKSGAKDTLFYTLGKLVFGITGIVSIKLFTNLFDPEVYGNYVIVNTTVNILVMVLFGWLIHSGFRFASEYEEVEKKRAFYSTLFLCSGIITVVSLAIMAATVLVTNWSSKSLLAAGMLFLATQSNAMILFNLIRAYGMSKLYGLLLIVHSVLKLVVIYIMAVYWQMGVESIFLGGALLDLAIIMVMAVKIGLMGNWTVDSFSKTMFRRFFRYGYPLMGVSVSTWILSASDKYLIKLYHTAGEVGVYAISYSLVSVSFALLNTSLMLGMYPIILRTWNQYGRKSTEELMSKILRYYLMIAIPAWAGLSVLAEPLLHVLTAEAYVGGAVVISWVALGLVGQGLTEYITKIWELQENTKMIFYLMMAAAVFNIILNIIFVPQYGFYAAAITTVLSYVLYLALAIFFSYRDFRWKISISSLVKISIATLIMTLIIKKFISIIDGDIITLVVSIIIGLISYGLALLVTGEVTAEAKEAKALIKKKMKL